MKAFRITRGEMIESSAYGKGNELGQHGLAQEIPEHEDQGGSLSWKNKF